MSGKELPILFNTEMVEAILDGRKTVTRRPVKFCDSGNVKYKGKKWHPEDPNCIKGSPFGQIGDRLYVREAVYGLFHMDSEYSPVLTQVEYVADGNKKPSTDLYMREWRTVPSIHMPKKYARIWLEITDVRVERVHDINRADPFLEGCPSSVAGVDGDIQAAFMWFKTLWNTVYKNWSDNPWVWVVEFKSVDK